MVMVMLFGVLDKALPISGNDPKTTFLYHTSDIEHEKTKKTGPFSIDPGPGRGSDHVLRLSVMRSSTGR